MSRRKEMKELAKMLAGPCVFHVKIIDIKSGDVRVEYAFNTNEEAQEYIDRAINWETQRAELNISARGKVQ